MKANAEIRTWRWDLVQTVPIEIHRGANVNNDFICIRFSKDIVLTKDKTIVIILPKGVDIEQATEDNR